MKACVALEDSNLGPDPRQLATVVARGAGWSTDWTAHATGGTGAKPDCSFVSFVGMLVAMSMLTAEEQERAREALSQVGGHPRITTEDGTVIDLPEPVATALAEVLEAAAAGERALVLRSPNDITTEQAATVLGVSRPTVVRMIEAGKLPARMVGTHRRLTLSDVLAYRTVSAARRRAALDQMTRQAEELGLYD